MTPPGALAASPSLRDSPRRMHDTFEWSGPGAERIFWIDPPEVAGARHLRLRRSAGDDCWDFSAVLERGGEAREVGEAIQGERVAEDHAIKYAIQGIARAHGVSAAPGTPAPDAGEGELLVARLWKALTDRWGAPGSP